MLNWKYQQFTKTLFPKKQTPMRNKKNQRGKKLTPFIAVQEIHLLKYIYFYIYRYYFFQVQTPKIQERKGKKKPQNKCLSHPPPESVDPCLSKIRKSYLQKEEPEEGEGVGKRRMRL